eukprot:CAMPEP_0185504914 /NCGR_PEP_ID=MMETSP1366-20130426/35491_1 /TAXON_ID=38817 /ORGANISM="Gephyrocapsa oceanica, Strain RCC1303" /LENGTH=85 /DNA_ID=CAMNT_0028114921 /DNA_START=1 /DNA_END=255 /DNA_ORIENTATION=+
MCVTGWRCREGRCAAEAVQQTPPEIRRDPPRSAEISRDPSRSAEICRYHPRSSRDLPRYAEISRDQAEICRDQVHLKLYYDSSRI